MNWFMALECSYPKITLIPGVRGNYQDINSRFFDMTALNCGGRSSSDLGSSMNKI